MMSAPVVHISLNLAIAAAYVVFPAAVSRYIGRIPPELKGAVILLCASVLCAGIGHGLEGLQLHDLATEWLIMTAIISWVSVIYLVRCIQPMLDFIGVGHLILQYTPSGIGLFREGIAPDGVRDLKWELRSVSAIRDLGFDPMGESTWLGVAQPGHREGLLNDYLNVLDTGRPILGRELFYEDPVTITRGWFSQNVVRISRSRLLITWSNITNLKQAQEELEERLKIDTLTGLQNRYALSKVSNHGDFSGALYIDLDRFKSVNDTLGHDVGDALLRSVVQRLQLLLGREDQAFRLGGDEFLVLIADDLDLEGLVERGEHLLNELQRPYWIGDRSIQIDASIGVVDRSAGDLSKMLRSADLAMYAAKEAGGAVRPWDDAMVESQLRKERIQLELQSIRDRHSSEFELYYQPIVQLSDPSITTGVESLIRWKSKDLGWVSPGEFIPIAEDSGEIPRISNWVIEMAIAQVAKWHCRLPVSVNVSPCDLEQPNFVLNLRNTCDRYGVPLSHIALEVTERAVTNDVKYYQEVLTELSALRVALKIDDFGTGDSSLKRLLSTPWHTVKIDRSLVPVNAEDADRIRVCQAIAHLCHDFDLITVAEGVETKEQLDLLREIGIDEGQGYYFAKPMVAAKISV
ncbi:MAG: putative bifunctional diguanylate cyclase/phosphodiesterase [Cyanophyceae cyanobacterium]